MPLSKTLSTPHLSRRDMLSLGGGLLASAAIHPAFAAQSHTPQQPGPGDPMRYVAPELRPALLKLQQEHSGALDSVNAANLPQQRDRMAHSGKPLLPAPAVTETMIPGPAGAPPVRIYVAGAIPGARKPAVLHFHGGGYVMGTAATARRGLQELVLAHDCVAISVDYRLSPESRFPASLEDNYAALRWIHTHADTLGIDTARIAIKGESAGGGQAATLAIAVRNRGEFHLCLQVLLYPMLDDRTAITTPASPYLGHYIWTPASNRFGWSSLLGVPAGSATVPANAVPARVHDLKGLPPAFIAVGSIDLLAPEDMQYAQRLLDTGIPTELHLTPGAYHAFDEFAPDTPLTTTFNKAWNEALHQAFTTR